MNNPKVSIIIPVFNAEKYLSRCLDSVLIQSYENFELILINDGSSDSCGSICEDYARRDNRVRYINQENRGVSWSRNIGISLARGEFLQFVDADDTIDSEATELMVTAMENDCDLVISSYRSFFMTETNHTIIDSRCDGDRFYDNEEFLQDFGKLFKQSLINPIWNKLYSLQIVRNNELKFDHNIAMGEDLLFNLAYLKCCQKIYVVRKMLYNYIIFDMNSLTLKYKKDFFINQRDLYESVRTFLREHSAYTKKNQTVVEAIFTSSIIRCFDNLYHENSPLNSKERFERINKIMNDPTVLTNVVYFYQGSLQTTLTGFMIKHHYGCVINQCYGIKHTLKSSMKQMFLILKKVNEKIRLD